MSFRVIKAGFLATIQDYGRFGHATHGISCAGVMDEQAYSWGNYLLGNHFNRAALEITFGMVSLEASADTLIAVTGANADFCINKQSVPMWTSIPIHKGDILSWGNAKGGVRTYLAVKDGFNTQTLFSSKSVNLRENIGKKIATGDVLDYSESTQTSKQFTPDEYIPNYQQDLTLRLLPSYQFSSFSINQKDLFFNQHYRISNANDRTGCRLEGSPIPMKKANMISEGISYGSVEITSDGLPIILLKDAPTMGGYPKIGTVFSLDLAKLAQKPSNSKLKFDLITSKII